jgi:SPP1 family phage portal protein
MIVTDTDLTVAGIAAGSGMRLEDIIKIEVDEFLGSERREKMIEGAAYYRNKAKILDKRAVLQKRSNIKRIHAYVKKLTDQKIGYFLSLPPEITTANSQYQDILDDLLDKDFLKTLQGVGKDAITCGKAWIQPYVAGGDLKFRKYNPWEILPLWRDEAHTELDAVIRIFNLYEYRASQKTVVPHVEYWDKQEVRRYRYEFGALAFIGSETHLKVNETSWGWNRPPFVCFKYNDEELGLVEYIKSLVDDYDLQASKNSDILVDLALITYVLKGYQGTDLERFINDLKNYMVVNIEDGQGGLDALSVKPETQAVENLLDHTRQNIIEFGRGVDTQNEDLGNSSGVALKFRFADLDLDCNMMETEFQASFEQLEWFIKEFLHFSGRGDFRKEDAQIVFSRDIIINELEVIEMCEKSKGIVSDQTIRENHPWAAEDEAERMEKEKKEAEAEYERQVKLLGGPPEGGTDGEQ